MEVRVVEGIVAGTAAIGRFGSLVLRSAAWADRILDGKRVLAISLLAILVLLAPLFDRGGPGGVVSGVSLVLFVDVLLLLALARVDAFRDESGFQAKLVARTVGEGWQAVSDWATRLLQAPAGQKAIDGAKPVFFCGLVTAASASVAAAFDVDDDTVSTIQCAGLAALSFGAIVYGWGSWMLDKRARATGLTLDATTTAVANQSVQGLPLIVDCRDPSAVGLVAGRVSHPLVRALLVELSKPWPRPYYNDERECQDRLAKRLRLSIPEANPRRERWIGERQRADLLLGDEKAGVLIELKADASTGAMDRLIGQAWKYLDVWKGRGPMLLVLCRIDPEQTAERLQREVDRMRREGHAVLAVFAMP